MPTGMQRSLYDSEIADATGGRVTGRRQMRSDALLLAFGICSAFYLGVATERLDRTAAGVPVSYYAELAEGFRQGRLSLPAPPRPELLALRDPYDPILNRSYRRHDLSLYRGKYYLYFGATPAVVFYLPVRLLLGVYPSDPSAVLIFLLGGTAFWLALFGAALADWFPKVHPIWALLGGLAIGLCSCGPFLLARPAVYEICLSASYCFTGIAFCAVQRSVAKGPSPGNLAVAGDALELVVGCRPPVVLAVPVILAALWWRLRQEGITSVGKAVRRLLAFFIPVAVGGLVLGAYNYLRFDNPLQFGNGYQLSDVKALGLVYFSPSRIPRGLYYNLLTTQQISPEFPFVAPHQPPPGPPDYVEGYVGMLAAYPFLVSLLLLPFLLRRSEPKPEARMMIGLLATVGAVLLLLVCCFVGVGIRYQLEFGPPLVMAAVLTVCVAASSSRPWRRVAAVFAPLLLVGALQGALLGFTGYHNSYDLRHPGSIAAIRTKLLPIENLLARTIR